MDSNDVNPEQESSEMVQAAPSSESLPSSVAGLSLDAPSPKTFNDLPDQVLERILSYVDRKEARSLALVEQRWYDPARKRTLFFARGFNKLMSFADLVLERPRFASAIHHACLHGLTRQEVANQPWPFGYCPRLASRAIAMILEECSNLETISIGALHEEIPAQKELMSPLGKLHLRQVTLATPHHPIDIEALALAAPAFTEMETLTATVDMNDLLSLRIPFLPRCSVSELTLHVNDATTPGLQSLLDAFASKALDFHLFLSSTFLESEDTETSLSPPSLNTILKPIITSAPRFNLAINLADRSFARWNILDLPQDSSFIFVLHQPVDVPQFTAVWTVGDVQFVGERVKGMLMKIKPGRGRVQIWARRGRDWDGDGGQVFEVFAGAFGARVDASLAMLKISVGASRA
ncbi:hypothetical protein BCR35DRAFT_334997 [Leucosporidium creatinivorum]|uniref:F-box domain-containing protein n=1 Tax=Leucosporidium creatinivorum TaxID=106004 RepID=A0A1Y2DMB2_9BASI|nr:hypothetical protein BCR35DRAFT_334997 [Leucosporidium creatinivorum]